MVFAMPSLKGSVVRRNHTAIKLMDHTNHRLKLRRLLLIGSALLCFLARRGYCCSSVAVFALDALRFSYLLFFFCLQLPIKPMLHLLLYESLPLFSPLRSSQVDSFSRSFHSSPLPHLLPSLLLSQYRFLSHHLLSFIMCL